MMEEITRLSAALAERMRELRADPTDPRLAPLFAQYQALVRQHMATTVQATTALTVDYDFDLPTELDALLRGYLNACPAQAFGQAPALSDSETGRQILALPPVERVRMVV